MVTGGGALSDLRNVTKHKLIRPCVQEWGPKMRVDLSFWLRQAPWPSCILPTISPKIKEMSVLNSVYQLCNRFEVKSQQKKMFKITLTFESRVLTSVLKSFWTLLLKCGYYQDNCSFFWTFVDISNLFFILIWSTNFIFGLKILTAIVREQFIVFINDRMIFLLYSLAIF